MEIESPVLRAQTAWLWFFIGYFFIAVVPWIFPALSEFIGNTTSAGIVEVGVIIIEILFIIILPLSKASIVLFQPNNTDNPTKEITLSLIVLIFGLLITYFGYFMITNNGGAGGMVSLIEGTFQLTIFWIGLILTWLMTIIVAPINNIIKGTQ